jgi:hypothetical protein
MFIDNSLGPLARESLCIFYSYFSPLFYHRVVSFLNYLLYLEQIFISNILIDIQVRLLHFDMYMS